MSEQSLVPVLNLRLILLFRDKDNKYAFYEIKISYSVRLYIREALGQLMGYAFYPNCRCSQLFKVVDELDAKPNTNETIT